MLHIILQAKPKKFISSGILVPLLMPKHLKNYLPLRKTVVVI